MELLLIFDDNAPSCRDCEVDGIVDNIFKRQYKIHVALGKRKEYAVRTSNMSVFTTLINEAYKRSFPIKNLLIENYKTKVKHSFECYTDIDLGDLGIRFVEYNIKKTLFMYGEFMDTKPKGKKR
jgi:hypothetical protein